MTPICKKFEFGSIEAWTPVTTEESSVINQVIHFALEFERGFHFLLFTGFGFEVDAT